MCLTTRAAQQRRGRDRGVLRGVPAGRSGPSAATAGTLGNPARDSRPAGLGRPPEEPAK